VIFRRDPHPPRLFRWRGTPRLDSVTEEPGTPPGPPLAGMWATRAPLDREFDPCGAGPLKAPAHKSRRPRP
jgi:hypothetical protein